MLRRTLLGALPLALAAPALAQNAPPRSLKLVMLGTGTPNAEPDRSGPALAIMKGEHSYLFDAGPGIVRRATAAVQRHQLAALQPPNLDIVFLTHLHSDHTVGLPDLMFTPWVLERTAPLRVFGPPGTARMTRLLQEAYSEDVHVRISGLEPANTTGWRALATEIPHAGLAFENSDVRIEAIPVRHGSWRHAYGYRVSDGQSTIVISGDTAPCPAIVEAARGVDVLVHEVYSARRVVTRPPEWQRYHAAFHTSTRELAEIAAAARPSLLVLTHKLGWGATDAELVQELRDFGYDGSVVLPADLDLI
jgi:ribonuclease BN (tRNA processing enzyme)